MTSLGCFLIFAALWAGSDSNTFSRVIELTDRFLDIRRDGQWLVMFYAPWCGHCHKLEPVFLQAAQSLASTPVRVGKLDCTRFTSVANEFGIKGFPTILFLKGDEVFTFTRDRTRQELVAFAKRLSGPAIKELASCTDFQETLRQEKLFFLFAGSPAANPPLWSAFQASAHRLQDHLLFFSGSEDCVRWQVKDGTSVQFPAIMVFKSNDNLVMPALDASAVEFFNETVSKWVVENQFEEFLRVSHGNLPLVLQTNKYLILAVLEEDKVGKLSKDMEAFKADLEAVMRTNRDVFGNRVQFGWMSSPEMANSIAMQKLEVPSLLIVNASSYEHFVPEHESPSQMSRAEMKEFIVQVLRGDLLPQGGKGYAVSLRRTVFEARSTLGQMWNGNPVLTSVLFGLPLGFLSLICYSICCGDILEASDEDEPLLDDDSHEKKE